MKVSGRTRYGTQNLWLLSQMSKRLRHAALAPANIVIDYKRHDTGINVFCMSRSCDLETKIHVTYNIMYPVWSISTVFMVLDTVDNTSNTLVKLDSYNLLATLNTLQSFYHTTRYNTVLFITWPGLASKIII